MATGGKINLLIAFCILIFSLAALVNLSLAETAVVKFHFRDASELLPIVKTLLSPEGKASVDARTNAIIITDTNESLRRIRAAVANLDKPAEQVRIRFRFQQEDLSRERDLSASGKVSGKRWSVATGKRKRDGVSVRARSTRVNQHRSSESFITVTSGSSAYISVGKDIPYTERWVYLCRRYAHVVETVNFRSIETGMEVKPVVVGDQVQIEIVPRISYQEAGRRGVIRFTEASTKLAVPRGKWITIGGASEKSNEVIRDILSSGSTKKQSALSLSLMVEP